MDGEPVLKRPRVVLKGGRGRGSGAGSGPPSAAAAAGAVVRAALRGPTSASGGASALVPRRPLVLPDPERRALPSPPPKIPLRTVAPSAAPPRREPTAQTGPLVEFDARGESVRVLTKLLAQKPSTKLAQLVEKEGSRGHVIFVDVPAERFSCILDWYRYGEMFVPRNIPIMAVLRDARDLGLPDEVLVNGVRRRTGASAGRDVAQSLLSNVLKSWRGFEAYYDGLIDKIREHYRNIARSAGIPSTDVEEAYDFPPFVVPLYGEAGWTDAAQVCSGARARALALRLEEQGFWCDFTDAELLVSLPLRLKSELGDCGHAMEEEDYYGDEEEGVHEEVGACDQEGAAER